ncbi:MAG: phosphotransferase [Chloracidobacterium sp.]|uniref:Phosphotransferase n=1 Tax=Chloracidobacterium validum TaxID=2821543 RepID=A0ABX8B731_9BACT|nr:phosphotransferase [Chloracidobacterium validum]QUW02769.1 phosphotransferase [Chloracidobacterium validum]
MNHAPLPRPTDKLTAFLSDHFSPEPISLEPLLGDASTRMYFRIRQAEATYIAAVYAEPFDAKAWAYVDVTNLFQEAGIPVPQVLAVDERCGVVLQQDIGDCRLQDALLTEPELTRQVDYDIALRLIVDIQKTTPIARAKDSIAWQQAFDDEKLFWEMSYFFRNYVERYRQLPLSAELEALTLGELFALTYRLARVPRVVCHRDYHARNLMRHAGRLWVIDHQDARLGPATYDLASLLGDPYAALEDDVQAAFKERFWELHSAAFGNQYYASQKQFEHEYQLMLVQRLLKAVGTYAYQFAVRSNPVYLGYIPIALRTTAKALERIADLPLTTRLVQLALECEAKVAEPASVELPTPALEL